MESESKYIPYIHNYCDGWCEKCKYTPKCAIYDKIVDTQDRFGDSLDNEKFWEILAESLKETSKLLLQKLEELGLQMDEEEIEIQDEEKLNSIEVQLFLKSVKKYTKKSHVLLRNVNFQQEIERILNQNLQLGLLNQDQSEIEFKRVEYYLELLQRYQFLIEVKFKRAVLGLSDTTEDQFDMNGSAKLALILCDKSFKAWQVILKLNTNYEDEIIMFLALLQKIIREAELLFPIARNFIRPGLDE